MSRNPSHKVPLAVVGMDFRQASSRWRSRLVLSAEERDALARRLEESGLASGLAVLDTCNRNEWIAATSQPEWTGEILRAQMRRRLKGEDGQGKVPEPAVFFGCHAARHLLRVAAGLESFVLGERQVAVQIQRALLEARERGRSSPVLNGLAPAAGRAARAAKEIGLGSSTMRGVHDLAVHWLQRRLGDEEKTIAVLGMGSIGRQVVASLNVRTRFEVVAVNRTLPKPNRAHWRSLDDLSEILTRSDALVVATGSLTPVVTPDHLTRRGKKTNMALLDLGIPAQVHADCAAGPGVEYLGLDELQEAVRPSEGDLDKRERTEAAVAEQLTRFETFCLERDLGGILRTTQDQHDRFSRGIIPAFLKDEFPELDEAARKRLAFRLRGMLRDYTNAIFDSVHEFTQRREHDER